MRPVGQTLGHLPEQIVATTYQSSMGQLNDPDGLVFGRHHNMLIIASIASRCKSDSERSQGRCQVVIAKERSD